MVPLVAAAGFQWMATDELILARTLGIDVLPRRPRPRRSARAPVHAVSRAAPAARSVACVFRDHVLSDLIGFTYRAGRRTRPPTTSSRGWSRRAAAIATRTGGEEALIPIILDGENAWEHFEGGGRPFLRALYRRLSGPSRAADRDDGRGLPDAAQELPGIFPGLMDRRELLHLDRPSPTTSAPGASWRRPARRSTTRRRAVDAGAAGAGARGGADRRRQRLVLVVRRRPFVGPRRRVRRPVPPAPAERLPPAADARCPTSSSSATSRPARRPSAADRADGAAVADHRRRGTATSSGSGAGALEVREVAGAMHQTDRRPALIQPRSGSASTTSGCSSGSTPASPVVDLLAEGREFSLKFLDARRRPVLGPSAARPRSTGSFWDRQPTEPALARAWSRRRDGCRRHGPRTGACRSPTSGLTRRRSRSRSSWRCSTTPGRELERHPAHRPIELHGAGRAVRSAALDEPRR